jgi:hypothetical protein
MGNIFWKDSDVIQYIMTFELKYRIFLLNVKPEKTILIPLEQEEQKEEYIIPEDTYQM